jgi:hypothetical protein
VLDDFCIFNIIVKSLVRTCLELQNVSSEDIQNWQKYVQVHTYHNRLCTVRILALGC